MYNVYKNHEDRLPDVRIQKLELKNFKGVRYGAVEMNCAKEMGKNVKRVERDGLCITREPNTEKKEWSSDILALYGQNGSGKSSLVDACKTLKAIIGGYRLHQTFAKFINKGAKLAEIYVEFLFVYKDGTQALVTYEAALRAEEITEQTQDIEQSGDMEKKQLCMHVSDEVVRTNLYEDGRLGRLHAIVDTKENILCGKALEEYFFDKDDSDVRNELIYLKRKTYDDSQSFVFSQSLTKELDKKNTEEHCSKYYEILSELQYYATHYLYVVDSHTSMVALYGAGIPLYIQGLDKPVLLGKRKPLAMDLYEYVEQQFAKIDGMMHALIPDLHLELETTETVLENGQKGVFVNIISVRGDNRIPLLHESDGIIKLTSIVAVYLFAYQEKAATLVVDELDAGVFEYLLGQMLEIFESDGKGQLIFTSHNLRALEVLDKKFIRFTTANPSNRYYRFKSVGRTNNLRDLYLREIMTPKQDESLYSGNEIDTIKEAMEQLKDKWK